MSLTSSGLRDTVRSLLRSPGYALTAVAILGLGIGATSLVWMAFDAVVLHPLPFPESRRLVAVFESHEGRPMAMSPSNFNDLRESSKSFAAIAVQTESTYALSGVGGAAEQVLGALVTVDFFKALGIEAALGRTFGAADDQPDNTAVVLSHALWTRRYGADPAIVGKAIPVDGAQRTVVGVMPRGFSWPLKSELWTPLAFSAQSLQTQRGAHWLEGIGRLAPGVTREQANAEIQAIGDRLAQAYPKSNEGGSFTALSLAERLSRRSRPMLLLLLGAVVLALAAACANLASLSLARAVARGRELAVRASLGASPRQLARELVREAVAVALAGALLGCAVAAAAARSLPSWAGNLPRLDQAGLGLTTALLAAALAGVCGLLVGLAPALATLRRDPGVALQAGSRSVAGHRGAARVRRGLVVATTALAFVLVAGSVLVVRSYERLTSLDLGFETADRLSFSVNLPDGRYHRPEASSAVVTSIVERLSALPGVEGVAAEFGQPFSGFGYNISVNQKDGVSIADDRNAPTPEVRIVTPGFFKTHAIAVRSGRELTAADRFGAQNVILINERAAKELFPGVDPIGHHLGIGTTFDDDRGQANGDIVGVVADIRDQDRDAPAKATIYFAHDQFPTGFLTFTVKTVPGQLDRIAEPVRRAVGEIDPDLPIFAVRPLALLASESLFQRRFVARLLSAFAIAATVLASLGLFGILAGMVTERRRELAVRGALGAAPMQLLGLVVTQAVALLAIGLGLGLTGALSLGRFLASQLYEISPTDPAAMTVTALFLTTVGLAISWWPAHRAARIQPAQALRAE